MLKLIAFVIILESVAAATDYCAPALCPYNGPHVACGHSGAFDSSCPADGQLAALSEADIKTILKIHNEYRNKIAIGNEAGFEPATRMATMVSNNLCC